MWETVKLSEIVTFVRGLTYSKKDEVDANGLAVLRATNVSLEHHKIILDEIRYIKTPVKLNEDKLVKVGDILMCTASGSKSHLGKCALVKEDLGMAFGGFMAALRCKSSCLPEYLFYILTSNLFLRRLSSLSDGANINNLKFSQIEDFEFPLPPLAEQQRIVAKLDAAFAEIDGLINTASRQASNAKDVHLKIIENLFFSEEKEWNKINLRIACKFSQGVQISVEKQSLQVCEGCTTRFLRIVDFTQGNEEPRFISDSDVKEILNEHDIAIVRYGASAGFVCTGLKGQIANNLFKVELVTKEFDSDYLLCFLKSPMFSNFIASKVTGAAMPALSFSMFNDFDVSYPNSRDEQLSLISKFHLVDRQIENLISLHEKKLLNLKQLKQTILAQELQSEAA